MRYKVNATRLRPSIERELGSLEPLVAEQWDRFRESFATWERERDAMLRSYQEAVDGWMRRPWLLRKLCRKPLLAANREGFEVYGLCGRVVRRVAIERRAVPFPAETETGRKLKAYRRVLGQIERSTDDTVVLTGEDVRFLDLDVSALAESVDDGDR